MVNFIIEDEGKFVLFQLFIEREVLKDYEKHFNYATEMYKLKF